MLLQSFHGSDFQKHLSHCSERALLTSSQISDDKKIMLTTLAVGSALERWFPDMDLIIKNTAFLDPSLRKLQTT